MNDVKFGTKPDIETLAKGNDPFNSRLDRLNALSKNLENRVSGKNLDGKVSGQDAPQNMSSISQFAPDPRSNMTFQEFQKKDSNLSIDCG